MMEIKCNCGDNDCKAMLELCEETIMIHTENQTNSFILDANSIVELIHGLKKSLLKMTK